MPFISLITMQYAIIYMIQYTATPTGMTYLLLCSLELMYRCSVAQTSQLAISTMLDQPYMTHIYMYIYMHTHTLHSEESIRNLLHPDQLPKAVSIQYVHLFAYSVWFFPSVWSIDVCQSFSLSYTHTHTHTHTHMYDTLNTPHTHAHRYPYIQLHIPLIQLGEVAVKTIRSVPSMVGQARGQRLNWKSLALKLPTTY